MGGGREYPNGGADPGGVTHNFLSRTKLYPARICNYFNRLLGTERASPLSARRIDFIGHNFVWHLGGPYGSGTVLAINTDGMGFTTLYAFNATSGSQGFNGVNRDGAYPEAKLILSGKTLYPLLAVAGSLLFNRCDFD